MRLGHPRMRKLQRWLDGNEPSLDRHLDKCTHCSDRLETGVEDAETRIGLALRQLLSMPDQFPDRLQVTVDQRLSARDDLSLASELFGLPLRAARFLSTTGGET